MLAYPHWITVTAPAEPAGSDAVGDGGGFGEVVPPADPTAPVTVLDCACDAQDVGQVVPRHALGLPDNRADATIFVKDERPVFDVPVGARATVLFAPAQPDPRPLVGEVTYGRVLDGVLLVRFPATA